MRKDVGMLARAAIMVALAVPGASCLAAQLSFAHFAPGAGPVTLVISESSAVALDYRDFAGVRQIADGTRRIEVRDAVGTVLASDEITLGANDRDVVIFAGNGSESAPFQLRRSADHNRPFTIDGAQASLQTASLAIVDLGFASLSGASSGVSFARRCSGESSNSRKLSFGYGTSALDERSAPSSNVTLGKDFNSCIVNLSVPGYSEIMQQAAFSSRPGERKRIFVIGDGRREPYEVLTVLQGVERILAPLAVTPGFEGLWSIPGEANMGLQVAVNETPDGAFAATAIFFGYDEAGASQWNVISEVAGQRGLSVLEYTGGNPDGTQSAIALNRGTATLLFVSCEEAVLVPDASVAVFRSALALGEAPRESIWLRKLFPIGGCSVPGIG